MGKHPPPQFPPTSQPGLLRHDAIDSEDTRNVIPHMITNSIKYDTQHVAKHATMIGST